MKILFIQTGGTIDKDYPHRIQGYAFTIHEPAVKEILQRLNASFEYEILPLIKKDSLDLTNKDRELLKEVCESSSTSKIIITHGTDSMIQTAEYLSILKNKTIVLTGAFRPARFYDSDAAVNIGVAIGAIQLLNSGVYIAMNGLVLPWHKAYRHPESGQFIKKISHD